VASSVTGDIYGWGWNKHGQLGGGAEGGGGGGGVEVEGRREARLLEVGMP